jgi:ribosomal protein S18 acetylase RimI-like enzyme
MPTAPVRIERLRPPLPEADLDGLAALLVDAVADGAAVSFLGSLTVDEAKAWWRSTTEAARPRAVLLVARDPEGIVGTVQLQPAWAPNQNHRADVVKLIIHRRSRRLGLGRRLMAAIEEAAQEAGFSLLVLDARRGGAAEALYTRLGWIRAGVIPGYAVDPDGLRHDAVFFYKGLPSGGRLNP